MANRDPLLGGVQDRHEKEMIGLRNRIESITAKLNGKDSACDRLRQHLTDLNRTHAALLVGKTKTINDLMFGLEEIQYLCQHLMADVDKGHTIAEKEQLEKYVHQLKTELDTLQSDLKRYEAESQFRLLRPEDSDSVRMVCKPQPSSDLKIKLQDELQCCLAKYGSIEQLQLLYGMHMMEVLQLVHHVNQMREQARQEENQLYWQRVLLSAEKERAVLQNTQCIEDLISSRRRVAELEREVKNLKQNLLNVQQSNLKLSGELDAAQISVKYLEQKVSLLECSNMANRDTLLCGVQERHEMEMIDLRNRIESITAKLNGKECETWSFKGRNVD